MVASRMPPTGDLVCNPGMSPDWELNQRPFALQSSAQSTEPYQPGLPLYIPLLPPSFILFPSNLFSAELPGLSLWLKTSGSPPSMNYPQCWLHPHLTLPPDFALRILKTIVPSTLFVYPLLLYLLPHLPGMNSSEPRSRLLLFCSDSAQSFLLGTLA